MSCYALDVAFSLLCSPTCALACLYYQKRPKAGAVVQKFFFEAQGLFTVSVLVAAVVRIKQFPPLFEIAFLQYLNWTLAFSIYATFWSLLDSPRKWPTALYTCCTALLQITVFVLSESPQVIPENQRQLIDNCTKYLDTAPHYAGQDRSLHVVIICVVIVLAGIIPAFIWGYYRMKNESFEWKPVFKVYGICCAGMALYGATQLFVIRNVMRNATGSSFADDQWGFGQVAAVFMWVPWTIQSVEHIYSTWDRPLDLSTESPGITPGN